MVVIVGAMVLSRWIWPKTGASQFPRDAIAVLPFQNLSEDTSHTYFAGGLHEELLTQLANVSALKVISRTSVMEYAAGTKPLREIVDELHVGTIVEGSVQVLGKRLRVNVQLIDAATDDHLWAEHYDRTLDDAFAVQSDIARRIVASVGAALTSAEAKVLAAVPTQNAEGYRLYLQGEEYPHRPGLLRQNLNAALQLYEHALALDSTFALAYASLSVVEGELYWFGYDPNPGRLDRQREAARAALRLAPDLPQTHWAMGLAYYHGERNFELALKEFTVAAAGLPGSAELSLLDRVCATSPGQLERGAGGVREGDHLGPAQRRPVPSNRGARRGCGKRSSPSTIRLLSSHPIAARGQFRPSLGPWPESTQRYGGFLTTPGFTRAGVSLW